MKVLFLNANPKEDEFSRTMKIANEFLRIYKKEKPKDQITRVDLFDLDLPDIDRDVIKGNEFIANGGDFEELDEITKEKIRKRNIVLEQFKSSDKIILAAPMWEHSNPSVVQKWLDAIVVGDQTVIFTEKGEIGLCENKKALFIQTLGDDFTNKPERNFGLNQFKTMMEYIGIDDFESITAHGMDIGLLEENLPKAIEEAKELAYEF